MRRGPNPKPFLIMMIATLLVSSGLAYMQYSKYGDVAAEVAQLKKDQLDEKSVKADLAEAKGQLDASKVELSHLEQGVPEVAYVPTLLKELEKAGKDAGIAVLGVRPIPRATPVSMTAKSGEKSKNPKKKVYTELDIQVNARGDYKSVQNFVKAIQMFPKILATRTVSVQPAQTTQETKGIKKAGPELNVGLEFRAYLFPSDGSTKKAEPEGEAPKEKVIKISGRNTGVN